MCLFYKKIVYYLKVIIDNMLYEIRFSMVVQMKKVDWMLVIKYMVRNDNGMIWLEIKYGDYEVNC